MHPLTRVYPKETLMDLTTIRFEKEPDIYIDPHRHRPLNVTPNNYRRR